MIKRIHLHEFDIIEQTDSSLTEQNGKQQTKKADTLFEVSALFYIDKN